MKRFGWRRAAWSWLAVAVLSGTAAFAQGTWDRPAFSVSGSEMLRAAAGIKTDKPEPATVLSMGRRYVFDEAGRMSMTRHVVYRVNAPSGVEGWGSVGVFWEPWHQKQPQIRARVITSDGVEHLLDPKTLADAPAHDDTPDTYGDTRVYQGPLPAVSVGAVVEEESVVEDTEPFFSGGRTERVPFQANVFRYKQRLVIDAPASMDLHYVTALLPNVKVDRQESAGRVRLSFEQADMPAKEEIEPMLPSDAARQAFVEFSTGKSWQSVAKSYAAQMEPQVRLEEVKGLISQVGSAFGSANLGHQGAANLGHQRSLIAELVARMHREVRYTGLEFGEARLTPQTPAEVLKRKYGDCKDKAALLVAMLRSVGIPAYMALLNADNDDRDVLPESPGLGLFNHAIVYVPGKPDLWIDATAEFVPVGELPWQDQGRMALIVRDTTTGLTRIPECTAAQNVLREKREFKMADYGPAHITETSEPTGAFEVTLRATYAEPDSKARRDGLERYVKSAYLAEALTSVQQGEAKDLSKPFHVTLEVARAKRGYTDLQDAVAVILPSWMTSNLPDFFRQEEDKDAKDKPARTVDFEMWSAAAWEWQYRIVPPAGFKVAALPENKSQTMGPARFTQEYKAGDDGVVTATLRLSVDKRRFSAEEGKALRKGVLELQKADAITIGFQHEGYGLMAEGKGAAGLDVYRKIAAQYSKQALHQARLANAQLQLGLGESARKSARAAVALDPNSAVAYKTLGLALEFDLIGRRYKKGFDRDGAAAAYRKAMQLDPKDESLPALLAGVLEYSPEGERYAQGAKLDEAIAVLREVKKDKDRQGLDEPLCWDLMFARHFDELKAELAKGGTANRNWMKLVATAATVGPAAAIDESRRLISAEQERTAALNQAGLQLMRMRMYPQAAELLTAATAGQAESGRTIPMTDLLRRMKRHEEIVFKDDDPKAPMLQSLVAMSTGDLAKAKGLFVLRDAVEEKALLDDLKESRTLQTAAEKAGYPTDVLLDMILAGAMIRQEGDDNVGYRLNVQMLGVENQTEYVVKHNGRYLLLQSSRRNGASLGRQALALLDGGNIAGARRWLDWARDQQKLTGGDDPLAGPVFPRFWTKGQDADAQAMRNAAIALIASSKTAAAYLPGLEQARAGAKSDAERTNFDLALAYGYMATENWSAMRPPCERLLKAYPGSDTALELAGMAYSSLKQWPAWEAALEERKRRTPDDPVVQRLYANFYDMQGQTAKSREALKPLIESGRSTPVDLNGYAWDALFTGKVAQEDVEVAQRAATQAKSYAVMHTLACLYAEVGKLNQARQMLLESMEAASMSEPDGAIWYGMGRVAEQYGELDAAASAYARVEKPKPPEPARRAAG
jgi:tetratricopeptide (TPR) repeat protein